MTPQRQAKQPGEGGAAGTWDRMPAAWARKPKQCTVFPCFGSSVGAQLRACCARAHPTRTAPFCPCFHACQDLVIPMMHTPNKYKSSPFFGARELNRTMLAFFKGAGRRQAVDGQSDAPRAFPGLRPSFPLRPLRPPQAASSRTTRSTAGAPVSSWPTFRVRGRAGRRGSCAAPVARCAAPSACLLPAPARC